MGRMPLRIPRQIARLRRPAVCHRRMPQARHGTPRLGGNHTRGQMGCTGMQEPAPQVPATHPKDRTRRIYEPRRQPHGQLSGTDMQRDNPTIRHRRHPSRLHPIPRKLEPEGEPPAGQKLHHQHSPEDKPCREEPEAMGKDELLARGQVRRPDPLPKLRMECQHQGMPGCTGMAARRTDGRTLPDDVLPQRALLPLRASSTSPSASTNIRRWCRR